MTEKQRERAFEEICQKSSAYGVGIVSAEEIDEIGIDMAVKKAMLDALAKIEGQLHAALNFVIVDGSKTKVLETYTSQRILKGGLYHYSIAAGSILAKVTRDRMMKNMAKDYPEYGFEQHVGYGTAKHVAAIQSFGPCPLHRKSFAIVKDYFPEGY
jgi:ribonuclease HII